MLERWEQMGQLFGTLALITMTDMKTLAQSSQHAEVGSANNNSNKDLKYLFNEYGYKRQN